MSQEASQSETQCTEEIFQRIAGDLSMIADKELEVLDLSATVQNHRPVGAGSIHISFRLGLTAGDATHHGCLLVPLAEAITLAGSLMMLTDEDITERRGLESLDDPTKDAMIEVGNFVAGATEAAYRALDLPFQITFEGCQGVRADVRPALIYEEESPLVVAQAKVQLAEFGESTCVLVLPQNTCSREMAA